MYSRYLFNAIHSRILGCIACAVAVGAIAGCSQPVDSGGGMELVQTERASAEAAFVAVESRSVVWDRNTQPWGKELLLATDMGSLTRDALQSAWRIYTGYDATFAIDSALEPPEPVEVLGYDGGVRVTGKGPFHMSQRVQGIPPDPKERWIEAEVWVRADTLRAVSLTLRHSSAERDPVHVWHEGDGWQRMYVSGPFVWGSRPGDLDFRLVRRNESANVAIARPSIRILDTHPKLRTNVTGDVNQLIVNGDFETYLGVGVPYPWQMNFWDGEAGEVLLNEVTRDNGDTSQAIEMTHAQGSVRVYQLSPFLSEEHAGVAVKGFIDALSSAKGAMDLRLRVIDPDGSLVGDARTFAIHSGNGKWQRLEADVTLPADASLYPLRVSFEAIRRPEDSGSVFVDNASLVLAAE